MKRDRAVIYKDFYTNKFSAVKAVIVVYLDAAFEDFFNQYPFNSKNFKDYDHDKMLKHIVFDLCRIMGDALELFLIILNLQMLIKIDERLRYF